ncbi:hypothetical protein [Companilactobacillus sp. HBUAS56275]|uniref:Uncharacterized protein n=1 Tax=Candidatus Companilactobacillus pullicola TaxID=2838523 RepID=A0A9D1ZKQ7_9LACO|nr:hypothetical protein [Candidatus Companilactobacillus pullicola]
MKKFILAFFTILITIVSVLFIIPEISYTLQVESTINSELNNGKLLYKTANQETKSFLQKHHYKKVKNITDFQGSDGKTSYLVASLDEKNSLGIFISYNHFGPYLWNSHVISIKHFDS